MRNIPLEIYDKYGTQINGDLRKRYVLQISCGHEILKWSFFYSRVILLLFSGAKCYALVSINRRLVVLQKTNNVSKLSDVIFMR